MTAAEPEPVDDGPRTREEVVELSNHVRECWAAACNGDFSAVDGHLQSILTSYASGFAAVCAWATIAARCAAIDAPADGAFTMFATDRDGEVIDPEAETDPVARAGIVCARIIVAIGNGQQDDAMAHYDAFLETGQLTAEATALLAEEDAADDRDAVMTSRAMFIVTQMLVFAVKAARAAEQHEPETFDTVVAVNPGAFDQTIVTGIAFSPTGDDLAGALRQIDQRIRSIALRQGIELVPGPLEYDLPRAFELPRELRRMANTAFREARKAGLNAVDVQKAVIVRGWRRRAVDEASS